MFRPEVLVTGRASRGGLGPGTGATAACLTVKVMVFLAPESG
jgi:hypothetical protein